MATIRDSATVSDGEVFNPYSPAAMERLGPDFASPPCCATGETFGQSLHGNGPPAAGLGSDGDTYVDDVANSFYWKSASGWNP